MTDDLRRKSPLRAWKSRRLSILGWMLLLVGLTLAVSTSATAVVLTTQLRERVDERLAQEITEFRTLAARHTELTGPHGLDVAGLLEFALRALPPDPDHSFLALVDGEPIRPDTASALAAAPAVLAKLAVISEPTYGDADTTAGHIRYAAVPVTTDSGAVRGTFIVAGFPEREAAEIMDAVRTNAIVGIGALLLAAGVGWLFAGRLLAPLRVLRDTARSIGESDLTRRIVVHGHDEMADLAVTFNAMLDRLEDAFGTQRQFVDNASHELRTPITIIRANLELLGDDPRDRRQTVALVTDELDRMSRIVADLLTLAISERPGFVRPHPVELTAFVEDVFAKAGALAPRDWILERPEHIPPTLLHADRQRLDQAVIQLAQNATQHTDDGAPIWIGWDSNDRTARVWVRDSGPGIPAEQQTHVFERFGRATPKRSSGGAGLGLAIVKAIAEAHQGRVHLHSRPGHGATFTLELPVAVQAAQTPELTNA